MITTAGTPSAINVVTQGASGLDFKVAGGGSCSTATAYTVNQLCTVNFTFTPAAPGLRLGAITLTSTSAVTTANPNGTLATAFISGIGTGPQVAFPSNAALKTLGGGFVSPFGVAVDASGSVYVGDLGGGAVKKMAANCMSSSCVTTLGGGISSPVGIAVDGAGNVYFTNGSAISELPLATPPTVAFATPTLPSITDTTDGTMTVTVANIGNQGLQFSGVGYPADFVSAASASDCTSSLLLAVGASCVLPIQFSPTATTAAGPKSESVTLTDNALNASSAQQAVTATGILADQPLCNEHHADRRQYAAFRFRQRNDRGSFGGWSASQSGDIHIPHRAGILQLVQIVLRRGQQLELCF